GQAQPAAPRLGEQCHAQGAGLAEEADAARFGEGRGEGGVEAYVGGGVGHAEAVGADDAHAVPAGLADQLAFGGDTGGGTRLGEAAGDDDEPAHAGGGAVGHDGRYRRRGHGDDGQVDGGGDVAQETVRGDALHRAGTRVDGVDVAGVPGGPQVAEQRLADAGPAGARPVHGDRGRGEQRGHRGGLGVVLAAAGHPDRVGGRGDVEAEVDHAVGVLAVHGVAGVGEHAQHRAVLRQDLGDEPGDAVGTGGGGEVFQQDRADAPALVRVLDDEGDLGLVGADAVVPADRDQLVAELGDERLPVAVVDGDEPLEVPLRDPRVRREVPQVPGPVGEPGVQR